MSRKVRRPACILLCVLFAMACCANEASASEQKLPSSMLIGDTDGIHVGTDGQYFIQADNLRPGDVIKKTLTIRNVGLNETYQLSMLASPLTTSGPVDLLDAVHLTLVLSGRIIYSGRLRGDTGVNMITNALDLGEYGPDDSATLEITLKVDSDIEISRTKSVAEIKWIFAAVRTDGTDVTAPKTGDLIGYTISIAFLLSQLAVVLLLLAKRRKRENAGKGEPQ